jgi:hypothetical protein
MHLPSPIRLVACLVASVTFPALAPAPARGAIGREARAVVERYVQATGGRAAWNAERTLHAKLTLSGYGLTGTAEAWLAKPDKSLTVTHLGPINQQEGTFGDRAWQIDQNGQLRWLDGRDRETARAEAYFENEEWAATDQGGGEVESKERETYERVQYDVLEVHPPIGKTRKLYFNARTGLLERMTFRSDNQEIDVRQSNYERLAGRLRARTSVTRVPTMGGNDLTARVESVWANVAVDSTRFLPPSGPAQDFRFLDGAHAARIPMRYELGHVWVTASVNGQPPALFLLDTGASVTCLDSAYAASIGVQSEGAIQGGGAGATGTFHFADIRSLRLQGEAAQGVAIDGQKVVVLRLNPFLAPLFWKDTAGILGYDFMSRFVVTIDYERHLLTLDDPTTFVYHGDGSSIPVTFTSGIPVVHGTVNGEYEGEFRVDVGSGSSLDLHTPFVARHALKRKMGKCVPTMAGGFGGMFPELLCRGRTFAIGPFTIKEPVLALSEATAGALASEDYAGNIGNRILDRFTCIFDYGRKTLYLESTSRLTERDGGDRFGAAIAKDGGRYEVRFVIAGSAADRAGLAVGDEVRAVAGRPIASYAAQELRQMYEKSPDGTRILIDIVRGGKQKRLKVTLRSIV